MFVTAILVAMVGTALTPIYPRVEHPLARYARTANPIKQPGPSSYAPRAEEFKRPPIIEPSSEDGGTSRHAETLLTARVEQAENQAPGSASASAPEMPATKTTTQGADVSATGSVNPSSIATSDLPGSLGAPAVSLAAAAKRVADRCMSCHRGFRPHGLRARSSVRRRIRITQDRFTAF
jgi:hypothetical protein